MIKCCTIPFPQATKATYCETFFGFQIWGKSTKKTNNLLSIIIEDPEHFIICYKSGGKSYLFAYKPIL